jgi:YbbR domain-containing protein
MPELPGVDLGRAVWAIALSVAFWLLVQTELNPERSEVFDVAAEPTNVPSGLLVVNQADWRTVQVRLSAPRDVFAQLRSSQLRAVVDLRGAGPGQATFPIEVPPPEPLVRVGEPNPSRVSVRLEELARKTVPVRATLDGSPPFGYRPGRPTVSPNTLTISGPISFVRRVEFASVDVRVDGVTSDVNTTVTPVLIDAQGERVPATAPGAEVQPAGVQVQLSVTQQVSYKEVGVRPILRGNVPPGYWVQSVTVEPSVVTAIAEPQALSGVDSIDTEPIDLSGATASFSRPVALQVPQGLVLARSDQPLVTVQLVAVTMQQSLRVPVRVLGVEGDLYLASEVPVVEVAASGPADQGLSAADVQATVDATGLEVGRHVLPVRVRLPERYELAGLQPGSVAVVLQEASALAPTPTLPPPTVAPPAEPSPAAIDMSPTAAPTASATAAPSPTPSATSAVTPTRSATPTRTPTPAPRTPTRTATPRPTATER